MKKLYIQAELEIIRFEAKDIIATSDTFMDDEELPPVIVG
jgi:hypothetical protein